MRAESRERERERVGERERERGGSDTRRDINPAPSLQRMEQTGIAL